MKYLKSITCASLLLGGMLGTASSAAIVGGDVTHGSGSFSILDPTSTFSVGEDKFDDANLYAFNEDQNIIIPSAISVDIGTGPDKGDVVASHYVFFDPAALTSQKGYVDFDADIFGIATSTANLDASDFLLNNNVTYLNPSLRGLEAGDSVAIDTSNSKRLLIDWTASSPGDYVRVFTKQSSSGPPPSSPVPLPAGAPLILTALGALALLRRRRKEG
ncbi:VPLPA-CTERM sorting domain-containing protein [Roseovarius spongiae]|uniref:VPLPA-CTERM sorting domain-containing protein n=1 Tax=Roseovarius spongiae TaxID=2320272 RepID=A0A3A8AXT9_9RHOB|nr:VPLPA-CTERM sorting domain-containing protein [Roseovarius spongiae]RKF16139.1 VPLPA-CTERM sorting domain-containing protein [Roseovarius spongiae]